MTSPNPDQPPSSESRSSVSTTSAPTAKDRVYRSPMALVGGVLLLLVVCWLGFDALFKGHGHTPWLALAAMILIVPLVIAFTLRPAVFAGENRLRVRNPFRLISLPWAEVATLRSSYSNEVVAKSGGKYQLWSIPVSLRARKKAEVRKARVAADAARGAGAGAGAGRGGFGGFGGGSGAARAETDKVMDELRELLERHAEAESARGEVTVRWAYEVIVPALVGAVLLAVLWGVG